MAIKKSELYSSLWEGCDELRGGMDASQYKDYVLVLLFIKYVSDKYAGEPYAPITIPPGASFADLVALKDKPDIGDQINKKIIAPLAAENKLSDMPDFNDANKLGSGKEMVERLTNLIAIFEDKRLDFSKNRAEGDDILGDAYEYLMRHFATESGKSKGQFYTPAEVSRIMAQILGIREAKITSSTTVYDPTCGSGSLLLKVADEAREKPTLYGQEKDAATSGLARMNMILHNNPTATIAQGNTLADPKFTDGDSLKTFDYVVANPPFSDKRWSTGLDPLNDPHQRFQPFGTPPAKQGDYAYLLHIIRSLKSTGRGACILPHGVLFRGNAEADIRRALVRRGYIKGIIGLPANLFYGTGIPACIIVLDKRDAHADRGIFMIDASAGFMKDGPKNRLRAQDIHRIVDTFNRRLETPKYSRMVGLDEIEKNEYNLNLPRYIDSQVAEDLQDIEGHLKGGIPAADVDALREYWAVCPQLRQALFSPGRNAGILPAPGGVGFQPATPPSSPPPWHSRGYLPHFNGAGVRQAVTFRLADSVPAAQVEAWKQELQWQEGQAADSPQAVALRKQIEKYEDAGHGACHLRDPRVAQLVQDALLRFDGQRYRLLAWCIMPNHVHALVELAPDLSEAAALSDILHSWKSFTATQANRILGRTGAFWQTEYFDRYIRDEKHFRDALAYIQQNPVKAGLVRRAEEWPWSSEGEGKDGLEARSPGCRQDACAPAHDAPAYLTLAVDKAAIKSAIYEHPEFAAFIAGMNAHFATWRQGAAKTLRQLEPERFHPKELIAGLSEGLLEHYRNRPLINPYDVYQHLLDYWAETMQDDAYLVAADGWKAETYRVIEVKKNKDGSAGKEKDKGWTCDLVPKPLLVARFFADEQASIAKLESELEAVTAEMTGLEEEHGGEDGAFSELEKVNKAAVAARLKELAGTQASPAGTQASCLPPGKRASSPPSGKCPPGPSEEDSEIAVFRQWLKLNEREGDLKRELKSAEASLDAAACAKYPTLTEADIKALVVDDKWLAALDTAIHGEMDRISQALTRRVKELAERYETPLPEMTRRVAELEAKVNAHLAKMGFTP